MLNLSDLKQSKVYQEALSEGLEQGKQQEGVILITRLLSRTFGDLPPKVRALIKQLSLAQIEALAEALLEFSAIQNVVDWLQAHVD